jgi:hypothetical protein
MGQPGHGDAWSRPPESIGRCEVSGGTETSQYLEETESTEIPQVVVSERGVAQTRSMSSLRALWMGGCRTRWRPPQRPRLATPT